MCNSFADSHRKIILTSSRFGQLGLFSSFYQNDDSFLPFIVLIWPLWKSWHFEFLRTYWRSKWRILYFKANITTRTTTITMPQPKLVVVGCVNPQYHKCTIWVHDISVLHTWGSSTTRSSLIYSSDYICNMLTVFQ